MSLHKAFSWSALESIGSRFFDLIALLVVMNALPQGEVVLFGVATSAIFIFNLTLIAPETSLLRFQKVWASSGCLEDFIGSFMGFNALKVALHVGALLIVWFFWGGGGAFYAIVFSLITQLIQTAEISRIYHRMELEQSFVARFELTSKAIWMLACLSVFYFQTAAWYFTIFAVWALCSAAIWTVILRNKISFKINLLGCFNRVLEAVKGFSLWSHFAGVITLFLYNSNILFLQWFGGEEGQIALVTVVNKTANLFFVVPMFIQGFVPVLLANAQSSQSGFRLILLGNGVISAIQLIVFIIAGSWLGRVFGVSDESVDQYYMLGLWVCVGIFVLNITRPLSTFLMVKTPPWQVLIFVFLPVGIIAIGAFSYAAIYYKALGVATASCFIYLLLAVMLVVNYMLYRKNKS